MSENSGSHDSKYEDDILIMEAACTAVTSVCFSETTRRCIPEGYRLIHLSPHAQSSTLLNLYCLPAKTLCFTSDSGRL
jgi:hypothetical protein